MTAEKIYKEIKDSGDPFKKVAEFLVKKSENKPKKSEKTQTTK